MRRRVAREAACVRRERPSQGQEGNVRARAGGGALHNTGSFGKKQYVL